MIFKELVELIDGKQGSFWSLFFTFQSSLNGILIDGCLLER